MTKSELDEILEKHKKWLNDEEGGEKANLNGADLSGMDLIGVNLRGANLAEANLNEASLRIADLSKVNLYKANLREADLRGAVLSNANLSEADLRLAKLCRANFSEAYLFGASFCEADLREANLHGAFLHKVDLREANLRGADLRGADLSEAYSVGAIHGVYTAFFALCCPEEGSFIGFKRAGDKIIKLLIPEDAKRSSATSRKCRCSKAKVLSITNMNGSDSGLTEIRSNKDETFIYKVGETVSVTNFDENRWNECSTGIHFFITRDEAVNYNEN